MGASGDEARAPSRAGTQHQHASARRPRVLVLERHVALAEALCHVLEAAEYHARYVAEPSRSIVVQLRDAPPAAVVVGVESEGPLQERLALIEAVNGAGIPTIGLTGHVDDPVRRRLLRRAGTAWVVGRNESLERFVEVVSLAAQGVVPDGDGVDDGDAGGSAAARAQALEECFERLLRLAPREREILEHLSQGRTVDEIARIDQVAASTVRTQARNVLRKLEVSSQLAAVALLRWVRESTGQEP
ncbi:response regulator transcription factor [Nocardioides sp. CGMCC 1.13656]|uniref:helix-turn-helix transcriptional regulator n=1 Tax=Nocardioides TaxID=1839 RepID=UPI0012F94202|nr:LuxR C-terminal-related transcriptional regulator [Nocardioides sp. CGMCC 1.13656]MBA2953869.1 response regulator transcription factor [Nocardioides sp. CGMCC 1.13656]